MRKYILMLFALVATASFAQDNYWVNKAADSFESGTGSKKDPYIIKTAAQLAKMSKDMLVDTELNYDGVYFRMEADIDLAGAEWISIGTDVQKDDNTTVECKFAGIFDGNGHKISNLVGNYGLFGYTNLFAEIRNLTIESGKLSGNSMVGAIVGSNKGLIENCVNKASVSALVFNPGGIAGANMRGETGELSGIIRNCVNFGTVSSQDDSNNGSGSGGIAGSNSSIIEYCANYGSISAKTAQAGGIVATVDGGIVCNNYNRGHCSGREQVAGCVASLLARTTDAEVYSNYNAGLVDADTQDGNGPSAGSVVCVFFPFGGFPASLSHLYNDADVCTGLKVVRDYFPDGYDAATIMDMTTSEMKSEDFVKTLNEAGKTTEWMLKDGVNDGYPTFSWVDDSLTGILCEGVPSVDFSVYGYDGFITVTGAEDAVVTVYDMSGSVVAQGSVRTVASRQYETGLYVVNVNTGKVAKNFKIAL